MNNNNNNKRRPRSPALAKAFSILEILRRNGPCAISRIIELSALPRSSVYVLIEELSALGAVRRAGNGRYQLWTSLINQGLSSLKGLHIDDLIAPQLSSLLQETGCFEASFGVCACGDPLLLLRVEKGGTDPACAMRITPAGGALRICLMAFSEDHLSARLLQESGDAVKQRCDQAKWQGWALERCSDATGSELAAPVYDSRSRFLASVSLKGRHSDLSEQQLSAAVAAVRRCCLNIGGRLG